MERKEEELKALGLSMEKIEKMTDVAFASRKNSYSPYSKFAVGAAVLTECGQIFGGTNVENASFGLTLCAERVAICNAVTALGPKLKVVAVMASVDLPTFKWACGACCSAILEFGEEVVFVSVQPNRSFELKKIRQMVPFAFSKATLDLAE